MDHETSFSVSRNDICSAFGFKISFSVTLSFAKVIMFKFYQLLTEKLLINFASNVHRCLRLLKTNTCKECIRNVYTWLRAKFHLKKFHWNPFYVKMPHVLKRQSLGCLETRFLQFKNNSQFLDCKLASSIQPSEEAILGHKILLAAISPKLCSEIAKKERLQVSELFISRFTILFSCGWSLL